MPHHLFPVLSHLSRRVAATRRARELRRALRDPHIARDIGLPSQTSDHPRLPDYF